MTFLSVSRRNAIQSARKLDRDELCRWAFRHGKSDEQGAILLGCTLTAFQKRRRKLGLIRKSEGGVRPAATNEELAARKAKYRESLKEQIQVAPGPVHGLWDRQRAGGSPGCWA